jgi:hypothetical protein
MANKMTAFFKPKAKDTEPKMIYWKTTTSVKGTTAQVLVDEKARVGSYVQHATHGKVMLVSQPSPKKLEIEIQTDTSAWPVPGGIITMREIVDAVDCSDPQSVARARDASVYIQEPTPTDNTRTIQAKMMAVRRARFLREQGITESPTTTGKAKKPVGKGKGKAKTTEAPTEPKKRGRPKGSKDKAPRKPRAAGKVAWVYEGDKAPKGRQVATIGAAVRHDGIGSAILLEQVDLNQLQLQAGPEDSEYAVIVESAKCFAVDNLHVKETGAGSSSAGGEPKAKRRKSGGRKRHVLTEEEQSHGLNSLSTKADVDRVAKRLKREEAAGKRGKPLKPLRARKNVTWPTELKEQAVSIYLSKYAAGEDYEPCTQHLLTLPGYNRAGRKLSRALLRAWVLKAAESALQEPNEYGLIVTKAGRNPTVSAELYEELKSMVKSLAATRSIRVCTSSMQPVVRTLIVHKLGAEVLRPGSGGFVCGRTFLRQLAKDAGLRWRKPYGDARKPPADADEQIADMILRLAYLMKEHSIPRALVLNFDHTGLHFMQQRGNTFTQVEVDTAATHQSRRGKQKETKLKGLNDKRQATGTVGTSFAGDTLPGQLIVEGTPANHGALPDLDGCNYAKARGSSPGHTVGWRLVQHGLDASRGRLERTWLGHLVQTTNHWANIQTSYAILEFIIVPWLLEKKASMDLPPDHPAILIVDCWYGWKDQDKKKTLQNFRECKRRGFNPLSAMPRAHMPPLNSRTQTFASATRGSSYSLFQQPAQIWFSLRIVA